MELLTRGIRRILSAPTDTFSFQQHFDCDFKLDSNKEFGLYLHIPFCRSLCPYCPYNKILYDDTIVAAYINAVCNEIGLLADRIGNQQFESLYIGGGTPTLLIPGLEGILSKIRTHFTLSGPIAIETTPSDFTANKIKPLKDMGITFVSLGVQSFKQKYLSFLGRNHDSEATKRATALLLHKDFKVSNIDLIFAYPGQTLSELSEDLQKCIESGAEQVTCYPLFTFPYSKMGQFLKLKQVKMPNWRLRKQMYYTIVDFFTQKGYSPSSVWSFNRSRNGKYSSVTRDFYVGLGAGAASYTGSSFHFNTFSIPEYIKTVYQRIPVALKMNVSQKLEKLFWLYWRFYETEIPLVEYERLFKNPLFDDFGNEMKLLKLMGFFHRNNESIFLNKRGSFWIHLLQNQFALNYVNKIWTNCQREAWPSKIAI